MDRNKATMSTGIEWDDKPLIQLMVWKNYNNPETIHFIINKIMSIVEMEESLENKVKHLNFF